MLGLVLVIASPASAQIKIMPLGDSITRGGTGSTDDTGYRRSLYLSLIGAGYNVDFVGSLTSGIPTDFDRDHEGHSGWRDDQIAASVYGFLEDNPADVVLLHIGTNGLDPSPNDVEDILDEIDWYESDYGTEITVILAHIINRVPYSSTTTTFNNNVEAMAQDRINNPSNPAYPDKIIIVDMENGAGIVYNIDQTPPYDDGDMYDNLHPNDDGYAKMANVWMDALTDILPIADAGPDQAVDEGVTVTLDGSNSFDPDDGIATYLWNQIGGPPVTLSDITATKPTFVTPPVDLSGMVLTFQLAVRDHRGLQESDEVSVIINDNGISGFPDDVLTMRSSTGEPIGIKLDSGGNYISLYPIEPSTIPNTPDKPENLIYGLIDMKIKTDTPGGTVAVTFYLPTPAPDGYVWYKYSLINGWHDYSANAMFSPARDQITLVLIDGGIGDDDGFVNGVIVDPSGIATAPAGVPAGGQIILVSNGECFIATAAYGSHLGEEVKVLEQFRDEYLLTSYFGKDLVSFYYKHSPKLANFISRRPFLKSFVRVGLYPLVKVSKLVTEMEKDSR